MGAFLTESRALTTSVAFCVLALCFSFVSHGECRRTTTPPPTGVEFCSLCTQCLWCFTTNNCTDYPVSWLLPPPSLCQLSQARWGVCWMNFETLIITLGVLAAILIVSIFVCCCYCCCCSLRVCVPKGFYS
uniref:Uncharacterized protein n=1 Tax=Mola mola TaxID=94237 RepID=A0A3Q3VPH6_MOLML